MFKNFWITLFLCIFTAPLSYGAQDTMALSLKQSIDLALQNNIDVLLAKARSEEARGQKMVLNADLLPQIDAMASQQRTWWENLGALGFSNFGTIGPFNTFDASIMVSQRILDFSALEHAQADRIKWRASQLEIELASQQVILATCMAYIQALGYEEELASSYDDVSRAEHFLSLSEHQLDAGLASIVDVARDRTQLAQQTARQVELRLNVAKAQLELKRLIKIPLARPITLTDTLNNRAYDYLNADDAINQAKEDRMEMLVAHADSDYSLAELKASKFEYLPKINLTGQWGETGVTPEKDESHAANAMVSVSLPIWDSGSIAGDIKEKSGLNEEEKIKTDDLNWKIEEDVRVALETLMSTQAQVQAEKNVEDFAQKELNLAQDRFSSGLGDNIQVINAQDALTDARDKYVQSLAQYDQAQLNYFGAIGDPGSLIYLLTKGREIEMNTPAFLKKVPQKYLVTGIIAFVVICGFAYYQLISFEGTDDAFVDGHIAPVSAQVEGEVVEVLVQDNQMVKSGDILARIDDRDYTYKRDMAQADELAAQAELQEAQRDQERYQLLLSRQEVSKQEFDHTSLRVKNDLAQVMQKKAKLDLAQLDLDHTLIKAPINGKVSARSVEKGQYVLVGQPLLSVVSNDVWITANFKETQMKHMRPGNPVSIHVDAYPGVGFTGRVDSIQSGTGEVFSLLPAQNASGNYIKVVQRVPVKITIDNLSPDHPLWPGLSVSPKVDLRTTKG